MAVKWALDFSLLHTTQFHGIVASLGLCHKVDVFYRSLVVGNGSVRAVFAHGCGDEEGLGSFT